MLKIDFNENMIHEKKELIKKILMKDKTLLQECLMEILEPKKLNYEKIINNPEKVKEFISWLNLKIGLKEREYFLIIALSNSKKVLGHEILFTGTIDQCQVYFRDIFKYLILKNATSFILVHNHPSGDPTASFDDEILTRKLEDLLKEMHLGITLTDHLIVTENKSYSIKARRELN